MANKEMSELTAADLPLTGTELLISTQGGNSRKITVDQARGFPSGQTAALAQGDLLYVNGSDELVRLSKGTAGQVLVQNAGLTAPEWVSRGWTAMTEQATTSGTSIDFTSIPAGVKAIKLMFDRVSQSGSGQGIIIQLGDSGGVEATGYFTVGGYIAGDTTLSVGQDVGLYVAPGIGAAAAFSGNGELWRSSGNKWTYSGVFGDVAQGQIHYGAGSKTLSAELDRIRLTTIDGSSTFDVGSLNIAYLL